LLTFVRDAQGVSGTKIIPALAKSMPTVSNGGKTYTFFLRPGLKYSNGQPIKASDFLVAWERNLKIPWQAASFISAYIQGGMAYANGKAKTISGVTTDDATGMVKVNLVAPFEPMVDIFALANMAPVPASTPPKNLAATGTIGDGPYMWSSITPGHQYTVVKNPKFDVPGIPRGYADKVVYNVNPNVTANAEAVLNNSADVFDPGDTIPASILPQIKSQASDRYSAMPLNRAGTSGSPPTRSRSTTSTPAKRCWRRWTTGPSPGSTRASRRLTAT
jgi:peptide/nickel transport system substrate-binding protein